MYLAVEKESFDKGYVYAGIDVAEPVATELSQGCSIHCLRIRRKHRRGIGNPEARNAEVTVGTHVFG
jgi:hypothetical protein